MEDLPRESLFPQIEVTQQFLYEREPLIAGMSYALAKVARSDRAIRDREVTEALSSLARRYETQVNSGLYYQDASPSLAQQAIVAELEKTLQQYREVEQRHVGYAALRDSDVLRALVFLVRLALTRTSGRPKSRAFLDFLFAQFPEKEAVIASPIIAP
jgi:hypothetical protein